VFSGIEDKINETKETNNIEALVRYVCGAEVSGNTSWKTLGLRGLNGTILFDPTQPYDEDDVNITAVINNSGRVNATNFSVALLFDYKPSDSFHKAMNGVPINESETYNNAVCIYLYIDINPDYSPPVLVIKDKNNTEVARTSKSCWIHVPGDTVEIKQYNPNDFSPEYTISFYPVYRANLIRDENLTVNTNSSKNVSIRVRNVTVGDHSVLLFIDPEGNVPEDDKTDNIASRIMRVNATRDFTVTNVIAAKTNLSDTDTADITAEVANVGLRNGTANVSITDYETENRTYRYHFDKNLPVSYLPIAPNASLLKPEYDNLTIIHRPGVDSLQLHFERISLFESGKLLICNENGDKIFEKTGSYSREDYTILVPGDTAYIYNTSLATFLLSGYTAVNKLLYEENLQLNATKTWNESKDITVKNWLAATGNHRINVTVWNNTIKEINETNNTFILPLPVNASRDPTVVNITLDPEHPDDGEDVNITATVRNNGTKPATFTVDLWRNTTRLISQSELPEIGLLNHTQVTLAPGENATVTGVWKNISLYSAPTHVVTAIVDPLDEIDEINETQSDNELNKYLWMNYPDFTITKFNQPARKDKNTSVEITNQGALDASNVTVRLELGRYNPYPLAGSGFGYYKISHPGAADLRLHFINIDASQGWLGIQRNPGDKEVIMEYCKGVVSDVWTPLIEGDTVYIISFGSSFLIDEYRWGDVEYKTIDRLNVSESKNISLPLRWGKYERPTFLNVSVDPYDNITELNEYNNNRTAYIYADLVLRDVGTVFSEDGNLSSINATIWSNNRLEDGIAFPVCNFSVALIDRDSNEVLLTEQIYKNDTVYGGEEREVLFNVSEIMSKSERENRTSHLDVVVDFEKEIREINETNNNKTIDIGPDIVVGEIYTESLNDSSSCECIVGAVIRNEGNFRAENFSVRLHLNSTTGNINETVYENIPCLVPWGEYNETKLLFREDRVKVDPNHIYELVEVVADPENTVEELDEGNNENETEIGPDLKIDRINYYTAKGALREGDKLIVGEYQTIRILVNNTGKVGAANFVVKIGIKSTKTNTHIENSREVGCVLPGTIKFVDFKWTPNEPGWYVLNATVDLNNSVKETDEANNNKTWELIKVASSGGYKAKPGSLKAEEGERGEEFSGGIIYTVGDTKRLGSEDFNDNELLTNFSNPITEGAHKKSVRLYVYPDYAYYLKPLALSYQKEEGEVSEWMAFLPNETQLKVTFNYDSTVLSNPSYTLKVNNPDEPVDIPDATSKNGSYATYHYDVTKYYDDEGANNWAKAERLEYPNTSYRYGIAGMALLIVYKDDDAPLMRYWIADDRDLVFAKTTNPDESTGFEYDKCIRKVEFENVTDAQLANASLKVVLVSYSPDKPLYQDAGGVADALYFNPSNKKNPDLNENLSIKVKNKGHWCKLKGDIAITNGDNNGWEYVDVRNGTNYAAIQSRGAMFGFAHAILKVTYPPDLEPVVPTRLNANAGASYNIPITIHNWGKSKAKNFNVTVSIDGNVINKTLISEIKGAGQEGDTVTINIPQKAPAVERIDTFEVNVSVDPENRVNELINKYPRGKQHKSNGEENNIWNGTVTVVVRSSGWGPDPGGGDGTDGTDGVGGTGTGSGSGTAKGVAGGTGQSGGESGGKTITGRLMKGVIVPGGKEAGGGGKGEFSPLRFFIQLVMLAATILLVYIGYLMERRRQNNK